MNRERGRNWQLTDGRLQRQRGRSNAGRKAGRAPPKLLVNNLHQGSWTLIVIAVLSVNPSLLFVIQLRFLASAEMFDITAVRELMSRM